MDKLGLRHDQDPQDMLVEFDNNIRRASTSGWQHLTSKLNPPSVNDTLDTVSLHGAIDPAFSVNASIIRKVPLPLCSGNQTDHDTTLP